MYLLELCRLFSSMTVVTVFPIKDATNITPTTVSATPVLDNKGSDLGT